MNDALAYLVMAREGVEEISTLGGRFERLGAGAGIRTRAPSAGTGSPPRGSRPAPWSARPPRLSEPGAQPFKPCLTEQDLKRKES